MRPVASEKKLASSVCNETTRSVWPVTVEPINHVPHTSFVHATPFLNARARSTFTSGWSLLGAAHPYCVCDHISGGFVGMSARRFVRLDTSPKTSGRV